MILPTQALYTITCHQGKGVSFSVHFLSHVHCKKNMFFKFHFLQRSQETSGGSGSGHLRGIAGRVT